MAKKKGGKGRRPDPSARARKRPAPRPAATAAGGTGGGRAAKTVGMAKAAADGGGAPKVSRAERIEAARKARRRKSLITRTVVAVIVAAVVSGIASLVASDKRASQKTIDKLEAGGCKFDRKTDADDGPGRIHVQDPTYEVNPPAGGNHLPTAAGPGIYTAENAPPDGQVVHAQEHGYVILWYRPDLPASQLDELKGLTNRYSRDVLLVPRPSSPVPVAATTWHRRLLCQKADAAAVETFITSFRNQGPEKVTHN